MPGASRRREPLAPRSDPEAPAPVFQHRRDLAIGKARRRSRPALQDGAEEIAPRVEAVDPASPGAGPHVPRRVDQDAREAVGRQAVGPLGVVPVPAARAARGVVRHETAVPRRDPEHAARIDRDRRDDRNVLARRQLRKRHVVQRSVGRIEPVQVALRPEPQGARRILGDGEHEPIRLGRARLAREGNPRDAARRGIDPRDPAPDGRDPQTTPPVELQRVHVVVGNRRGVGRRPRGSARTSESSGSSRFSPSCVPTQSEPSRHSAIAYTLSWLRLVGSAGSCRSTSKRPVARSSRASPPVFVPTHRRPCPVFEDDADRVVRKRVGVSDLVLEAPYGVAVPERPAPRASRPTGTRRDRGTAR